MTLITKNATTSEEQKELERLKKELSESMKSSPKIGLLLTNKSLEQSYATDEDCYLIIA